MKKILGNFEEVICTIVLAVMLVLTFTNVISRYFLHASISFTEEITSNLFVLLSVMGTAVAARRSAHLGLSIITDRLSEKGKMKAACIANILSAIFGLLLLYTGILMVQNQMRINSRTITLQWPEWIYGSFLPLGAFFIVMRFGVESIKCFRKVKEIK